MDFLRRKAQTQRLLRRATVPCFIVRIKTVVVAVAVEIRKTLAGGDPERDVLCIPQKYIEDYKENSVRIVPEVVLHQEFSSSCAILAQDYAQDFNTPSGIQSARSNGADFAPWSWFGYTSLYIAPHNS
jgi:hypothetical protein